MMELSQRMTAFSGNVFADMDRAKAQAEASGKTIIDLSLGSSDLPTHPKIIKTIQTALEDPSTHGYLLHRETFEFRKAVSQWYTNRYGVAINPETEVLPLIGCQEGTAHLPLAILNPGDFALLTDPGYPSHAGGVNLASGQIYRMPLLAENHFLPILADIPSEILAQSKLMVLSYPHNPTSATASLSFFQKTVQFCHDNHLVLIHDFPYADIYYGEEHQPPSMLQADPEKTLTVEFFTFSKSYNMGGFRIGFALGNAQLIQALKQLKSVIDFNQYRGILQGAITALKHSSEIVQPTVQTFQKRREFFLHALAQIGWEIPQPTATMYLWAKLPATWQGTSMEFCTALVSETGVALAPGSGFGKSGEGYVRFALVQELEILEEVARRIDFFLRSHR